YLSKKNTKKMTPVQDTPSCYWIKELCQQFPHGITDQVIQNDLPHVEPQQRAMAINRLLSVVSVQYLHSISIFVDFNLLHNLNSQTVLHTASKKKVYMLYNLQPDRSITGGAWYSDQDFESEFVEVLNQQCFKFLQSKAEAARDSKQSPMVQRNSSFATSHEVWKYICELGISKASLNLLTLYTYKNEIKLDFFLIFKMNFSALTFPLSLLQVFDDCHEGGEISPSTCIYMAEWLDF
uniref:Polymerase (RNA) III (DNA directed) polypeptide F n=1 Tax=Astyanax mexicanus TaxID=7994 RepID=A0A8B9JRH7_ASTMX